MSARIPQQDVRDYLAAVPGAPFGAADVNIRCCYPRSPVQPGTSAVGVWIDASERGPRKYYGAGGNYFTAGEEAGRRGALCVQVESQRADRLGQLARAHFQIRCARRKFKRPFVHQRRVSHAVGLGAAGSQALDGVPGAGANSPSAYTSGRPLVASSLQDVQVTWSTSAGPVELLGQLAGLRHGRRGGVDTEPLEDLPRPLS
jgi:hypothetical protein